MKKLENLHVAFWLAKDYARCSTTKWLGLAMVLPTILVAAKIARDSRHDDEDFAHNLAVCCWMGANITWMVGEFYFDDSTRHIAKIFFYAGIAVLFLHYAITGTRSLSNRRK